MAAEVLEAPGHVRGKAVRNALLRHYVDELINLSSFSRGLGDRNPLEPEGGKGPFNSGLTLPA